MAQFQVHARVLDLLGEQQIADLPTAVSELFKNAYDAYADKVFLDVHRDEKLVVLWDDGKGMSEQDVLSRWLVIGTPGKVLEKASQPSGKRLRPVMGEKGIGRLAISRLGDSLLLITKKVSDDSKEQNGPYTALFLNWNVARNPRLLLSDINVPELSFDNLNDLDSSIVGSMVELFRQSITDPQHESKWRGQELSKLRQKILGQLDSFKPDLSTLKRSGFYKQDKGTAFIVADIHDDLHTYVAGRDRYDDDNAERLHVVQLLSNFTNRFRDLTTLNNDDGFATDVRIFTENKIAPRSVFDDDQVFQPEDLRLYDHHFDMHFDEFGRYDGVLEVYGQPVELPGIGEQPRQNLTCGPFDLKFWHWEQDRKNTSVELATWERIRSKLEHFGGIMMYRDELRVLPYGKPEFDWLRIEERRSKKLGRYVFSHRGLFGYVAISREANPKLCDKAGREGLINNVAYRQLKQRLETFLADIATRYFYKSEEYSIRKEQMQPELRRLAAAAKNADARRDRLTKDLEEAQKKLSEAESEIDALRQQILSDVNQLSEPTDIELDTALDRFEKQAKTIESQCSVNIPKNLSIRRHFELRKNVDNYTKAHVVVRQHLAAARTHVVDSLGEHYPETERRRLSRKMISDVRDQAKMRIGKAYASLLKERKAATDQLLEWIDGKKESHFVSIDDELIRLTAATSIDEALKTAINEPGAIVAKLEDITSDIEAETAELSERLSDYLLGFFKANLDQVMASQMDELERLQDEMTKLAELAQIGLSVEVIDHELHKSYRGISTGLQTLRHWARSNSKVQERIETVMAWFNSLEHQYRQLRPLYRSSFRIREIISGNQIKEFVQGFMAAQLKTNNVEISTTPKFDAMKVYDAKALLMPVFVNLVDNAVYWLRKVEKRKIVFDYVDNIITICDNGPGIHDALLEHIFEAFVSTRPQGRGLGLYIARQTLGLSSHEIWASNDSHFRKLGGACLCIRFYEEALRLAQEGEA